MVFRICISTSRRLNLVYLCYQLLYAEGIPSFMLQTHQENRFLPAKEGHPSFRNAKHFFMQMSET